MSHYEKAFECTTEADTCTYCGEEFGRSGLSDGAPVASGEDWEKRVRHLDDVHKIGECNRKIFHRADHFRQHLKHSHAGKTGKWTNVLENTCKREKSAEYCRGVEQADSVVPSSPGSSFFWQSQALS
jgi:hypothetical protein